MVYFRSTLHIDRSKEINLRSLKLGWVPRDGCPYCPLTTAPTEESATLEVMPPLPPIDVVNEGTSTAPTRSPPTRSAGLTIYTPTNEPLSELPSDESTIYQQIINKLSTTHT